MTLPKLLPTPDPTKSVRVRLLSPLGHYPRHPVLVPGARLLSRDELVVSVVETAPPDAHGLGDEHYSDLEILALEEIRFLAALALSVHPDNGMMFAYPLDRHLDVATGLDDHAVLDLAALKTPPGDYLIAFYGSAVAKYRQQPAEQPKDIVDIVVSEPIAIRVKPAETK